MDKLVQSLVITGLSRSQVSVMAKDLDAQVADFRTRPLDAGLNAFLAADALTMKVREGGRVVKVAVMVATAVNGDGFQDPGRPGRLGRVRGRVVDVFVVVPRRRSPALNTGGSAGGPTLDRENVCSSEGLWVVRAVRSANVVSEVLPRSRASSRTSHQRRSSHF